jgi:hypothetical protein
MDRKTDRLIRDAQAALGRLKAHLESLEKQTRPGEEHWFHRPGKMLWLIREQGGQVTTEEFYRLGAELGYDRRGLGGFFSGKNPTLEIAGDGSPPGDRRLTPVGEIEAQRWAQQFGIEEAS